MSRTIGLDRDPEVLGLHSSLHPILKRLWWSCYMCDRLLSLSLRLPTLINHEEMDVPLAAESDFPRHSLADSMD
jgi:hypothetical protein